MNIDLPVQFKDIKLNDREKIFAWMIVELSKKLESPRWELVSLFLSKFDVTHILGRTDGNRLTNLRKVFNIAILNDYTVSVQWDRFKASGDVGPARRFPATFTTTLDSDKQLIMYVYLLGRLAGNNDVFSDDQTELLRSRNTSHPFNRATHTLYKSFYADELYGDE